VVIALLLLAALLPCLVHGDSHQSGDLCLSFGLLLDPVIVPSPVPAGHFQPAVVTVCEAVAADLPVPPPKA